MNGSHHRPWLFRRAILWVGLVALLHLASCSISNVLEYVPFKAPGLADLLGESEGITTDIRGALTSMPSLDGYGPKTFAPMTRLGRGPNNGFLVSRPGTYELNSRSYCLFAGTYGPTKGDGYVFAPLAGPRASMIQKIARNTVVHRQIPQRDVQALIWTILERGNLFLAPAGVKTAASTLLSEKDINSINRSAITKFVSDEVLTRAMDKMPEAVRPMMEARAKVRSMLGKGYSSYGDLERAAVLTGTHPMGKGSLDVKSGRWSFHPDGYFVRYFPTGYSQTLIQLQVPSGYSVKRDNLNRITSVSNDLGQGLEIEYDAASAPVPLDGESKVKACAFTSLRLVQFTPVGPETGKPRQRIQPQKGWTLMGECSGKARFKNAPEAYSGLKQRYENALALDAEAKRVIKASRKYGRSSAGGSLSILSKADIADLGHLLVALQSASTGGAKNPSAGASDPVAFVLEAWQRALCEQAGAGIDFRGKSTPTPKAFPPAGAGFWEAPPAPAPPGTEGPKFPEFDPTAGAATPGNTSNQRLLPSATPTQEQPEEPCKEKIAIAIRTGDGQDKYCFSEAAPGKLEFTLEASVTPGALADEVTWTLPDLQGSTRVMSPANGKGRTIKVTYSGLPKNNSDFGPKKITAVVIKDRCQAQAEKEVRLFFPLLAKNNPGGADPNWFYYWKQTSACVGPARYGGDALKCNISSGSRDLGYYRSNAFDTVYNICDLKALGPDFPFNAKQWVGVKMSDVRVTGIDTFAVACQHENAHYSHFTQWWKKYQTADKFLDTNKNGILDEKEKELDKDGDLVPDALEKGLQLDPTNRNTYGIGPDGDDEEVLCWFAEATWKIGKADKEDWAKPGKQWK